jgi:hypothetical protein
MQALFKSRQAHCERDFSGPGETDLTVRFPAIDATHAIRSHRYFEIGYRGIPDDAAGNQKQVDLRAHY